MSKHHEPTGRTGDQQIILRSPAELADALPYVLGYRPTDSIVVVALHGSRGRFGGRVRLGIPRDAEEWAAVARQLARCLVDGSERHGGRPDGMVVFLCQDPAGGESGRAVMERLRPLAQRLRVACGELDVPVYEALCLSGGRFWSYCCPDERCCPAEGRTQVLPGTSLMAAAATYAGVHVRGSLRDMEARLEPSQVSGRPGQEEALDRAAAALVPRILGQGGRERAMADTLRLAQEVMRRFSGPVPTVGWSMADAADDRLVTDDEAAALIMGLQDRITRDRAAEWWQEPGAGRALRLWRALARRCVGPYAEHAAAPLTLAGWVAWSTGDEPAGRVALGAALRRDPGYLLARLLHQACNEALDPETVRGCFRAEPEPGEQVPTPPGGRADDAGPVRPAGSADGPPRGGSAGPPPADKPTRPMGSRPGSRTPSDGSRRASRGGVVRPRGAGRAPRPGPRGGL
ncbi:DUF4192 domain-containing protein [Streptomyces sp. NPDC057638]|uniref:DUF4192 domain-containing protein n=1 Tax=Streptomyces sp. NPDC057638 TaxID=3346190 RepID=UPI00368D8AB5